jgi:hypothetical protein
VNKVLVVVVGALLFGRVGFGQRLATSPPAELPEARAQGPLRAAKAALKSGDRDGAAGHLRVALAARPFDLAILSDLLAASEDDASAALLWSEAWRRAASDAEGKTTPDSQTTKRLKGGKAASALTAARAAAIKEIARLAKSEQASKPRSRAFLRRLALLASEIADGAPAFGPTLKALDAAIETYEPDPKPVVAALEAVVAEHASTATPDLAVAAAQVLIGLGRQAAFPDLRGPKAPDLSAAAAVGRAAIERVRAERAKSDAPETVDSLRAKSAEERAAFTKDRATWANPGVATSPKGRYRVETICGFETLLATAETIEAHHDRLAAWFGVDPFKDRQGIVRVTPDHAGLEAEGAPYWWAGGFQSGDVTTVAFQVGNEERLGRTLVHELTHRFDGALHPFLPAWAAEGRGVWTGAAYGNAYDAAFTENHASYGTIEDAFIKGYGSLEKLLDLLDGTLKDYRDNYPVGYSLFTYLKTWEENGEPVFAGKLPAYLKGGLKGRGRPRDWFVSCFCDGKGGRPPKIEAFAQGFETFLKGFYWQSRAEWTKRYAQRAGKRRSAPWVYDGPTWHAERARAEPWFGQDQARRAGDVLFDAGKKKEAALAYLWAIEVDDHDSRVSTRLAEILSTQGRKDLAWCVAAEDRRLAPRFAPDPGPAPFLGSLAKTRAFVQAFDDMIDEARRDGAHSAAACFGSDRDRVATLLGLPPLALTAPKEAFLGRRHEGDPPPRPLGLYGYVEDGLTDYEERRAANLWFTTPEGDLHVGRTKPREGTGSLDRALWRRDAFARTNEWIPAGRYVVEGRVFFTTSFCAGAVVFGFRRADRVVRFQFDGGDYLYSAGVNDAPSKLESIGWNLNARRIRDGGLSGAAPGGRFAFGGERSSFRFALIVDGPTATLVLDEAIVGSYTDAEGVPIEGHVGFAASWGAFQVAEASLRRLDRGRASQVRRVDDAGLDLARESTTTGDLLRNRETSGVALGPRGTILIFLPAPVRPPESEEETAFAFAELLDAARAVPVMTRGAPDGLRFVVAAPDFLGDSGRAALNDALRERGVVPGLEVVTHARKTPLRTFGVEGRPKDPVPTVAFVDPYGVYRADADLVGFPDELPQPVLHWARAFAGALPREAPR